MATREVTAEDLKAWAEADADKRAFRSATRVGRTYRKPRGKNGQTLGERVKLDRKRVGGPDYKAKKVKGKTEDQLAKLARERRIKKMLARILTDGDPED